MSNLTNTEVRNFCDLWQGLNLIYEEYARSVNIPYTTLYILSLLTRTDHCDEITQKFICERTFLPRQTVNTIITGFYKNGLVELRELPQDRRTKSIHLTQSGQEYADKVIPHIFDAEKRAMEKLTEEQRTALLNGMKAYCNSFREEMTRK